MRFKFLKWVESVTKSEVHIGPSLITHLCFCILFWEKPVFKNPPKK